MCKQLKTEDFIKKAIDVYGSTAYNYDLVDYVNNKIKVKIKCNTCGNIFIKNPSDFIHRKSGCNICSIRRVTMKNTRTLDSFIKQAQQRHGIDTYNYDLVDYKTNKDKVKILCNRCNNVFEQRPSNHTSEGNGCPSCSVDKVSEKNKKLQSSFITDAQKVHGIDSYNYDLVDYKSNKDKVKILCNRCNNVFEQTPNQHTSHRCGCPNCQTSKGETLIKRFLDDNNIGYIQQAKFANCVNKKPLPFDFHITHQNILIEYQGIQHYQSSDHFGGQEAFQQRQINDQIKRGYAKDNNIKLLEIPYTLSNEEIITLLTAIFSTRN